MPQLSIIVPIHNAENTIGRCIDSILNQTYRDFELLLLDDGSTDTSGQVCDAYAGKDKRIRILHKENSGVSDTRNQGIALAKGEYLQFVDSDDWVTPDAAERFVSAAVENSCDLVIADFYRVVGERVSRKGSIEAAGVMDRTGYAAHMMQKPADFYYGVLWNKLYRRSVIEKYQLKMDASISWCEDFMFNLEYIRHAQRIYALKAPVYYYVKTKGSLVSQGLSMKKTIQMKRTVFACYNEFYKDILDEAEYEKRKGQVYRFLLDAASDGAVLPVGLPGNYRLGDERFMVSEAVLAGEGMFFDSCRERKMQDKIFEAVAGGKDLSAVDLKLLRFLDRLGTDCTLKETADVLDVSRRRLSMAIQRLLTRELIALQEREGTRGNDKEREKRQGSKKRMYAGEYAVTQKAQGILEEISLALRDLERILYEGFTPEEVAVYKGLNERRRKNIQEALNKQATVAGGEGSGLSP